MADHPGDTHVAFVLKHLMPCAPGFAGAVLSLAFVERLTFRGRVLAVGVGLASAVFLAPALADLADLFWPGELPKSVRTGLEFLTGLMAMGCLPKFLEFLQRFAGDPLRMLKVSIGPRAGEGL